MSWRPRFDKFNAWMTDDAIRSVIENLDALPATIEGNRQVLAWLRGERQWFDDEANRYRRVNLMSTMKLLATIHSM